MVNIARLAFLHDKATTLRDSLCFMMGGTVVPLSRLDAAPWSEISRDSEICAEYDRQMNDVIVETFDDCPQSPVHLMRHPSGNALLLWISERRYVTTTVSSDEADAVSALAQRPERGGPSTQ